MNAALEQRAADGMVQRGRHRDAHGIDLIENGAMILKPGHAQLGANPGRRLRIGIDDGDQPGAGDLRILLRMKASQVADADDGSAQRLQCLFGSSHRHLSPVVPDRGPLTRS